MPKVWSITGFSKKKGKSGNYTQNFENCPIAITLERPFTLSRLFNPKLYSHYASRKFLNFAEEFICKSWSLRYYPLKVRPHWQNARLHSFLTKHQLQNDKSIWFKMFFGSWHKIKIKKEEYRSAHFFFVLLVHFDDWTRRSKGKHCHKSIKTYTASHTLSYWHWNSFL